MSESFLKSWKVQTKKGLLLFLVLNVIKQKNCYGYEIIQKINEATGIKMADGTLYPLLKKLRNDQLVLCKWDVTEDQAPRKYYYLTGKGNSTLKEMNEYWFAQNIAINNLVKNEELVMV